jgi:hypothetical protein
LETTYARAKFIGLQSLADKAAKEGSGHTDVERYLRIS